MTNRVKACVSLLGILALYGCGGGGGESPPIADVTPGGIWQGTVNIQGQGVIGLLGFVTEEGDAHFFQDDGVQYWGTVDTSQRDLSGAFSAATPLGETFPDGSTGATGAITGTIVPYGTIAATLRLTTSAGATISGEIALEFNPDLYGRGVAIANLVGTYTDASAPGSDVLTIDDNGVIFGQQPSTSCVLNGQARRINPPYNIYSMRMTYSGCTGASGTLNGSTLEGLAILDFSSTPVSIVLGLGGTASGTPVSIFTVYERT